MANVTMKAGGAPKLAWGGAGMRKGEAKGAELELASNVPSVKAVEEVKEAVFPSPNSDFKSEVDFTKLEQEFSELFKAESSQKSTQGKVGRPIDIVTNTYPLKINATTVFHYDVEVYGLSGTVIEGIPDKRKARCASTVVNQKVMQALARQYRKDLNNALPAFDGRKNLYTRKVLPFNSKTFVVELKEDGDDRRFSVKIARSAAEPIDLSQISVMYGGEASVELHQEAIMAMDIIFRTALTLAYVPVGRSYFMTGLSRGFDVGGGKDVEFGIYSSIRLGQWQPILNVDISATLFYKPQPLVCFLQSVMNPRNPQMEVAFLRDDQRFRFQKEVNLLKVSTQHTGRTRKHRIDGLDRSSASEQTFDFDGRRITVQEYFRVKYKINLRYPKLPLVISGKVKKTYIPMELCTILPGQHYKRKASEFETAQMIRNTAKPPQERFRMLQQGLEICSTTARNHMDEFGISVSEMPIEAKGRVLPALSAEYANNQFVTAGTGAWKFDNFQFFKGATIKTWVVLVFTNLNLDQRSISCFTQMLVKNARRQGMTISPEPSLIRVARRNESVEAVFAEVKRKFGDSLDISVCLIDNSDTYCQVKSCGETRSNLIMLTQCIKSVTVIKKCNDQVGQNIMQKMNTKMGGINHHMVKNDRPLMMTNKRVMVLGIDVCHARPSDFETPSIVAFTATYDSIPAKYFNTTAIQRRDTNNRVEVVQDAERLFGECYDNFFKENQAYPGRIVVYRDGVSEGEFDQVLKTELIAMRKAVLKRDSNHIPSFVFITVQKRHHVRFMPKNPRDGREKPLNVPPGTVVDSDITNPNFFDFYLVSQAGIQGTSKPAHYFVLHNDERIPPDEIIRMTYYLCHVFFRCSRTVSLPAPVYYAHLGAERAKNHLNAVRDKLGFNSDSASASSGGDRSFDLMEYNKAITISPQLKSRNIYT